MPGVEQIDDLCSVAERLLDRELPLARRQELFSGPRFDVDLWQQMAEMGWFALLLPTDEDGFGLKPENLGELFALLGRFTAPGPFLDHIVIAPMLAPIVPSAARERLLAASAGTRRVALADPQIDLEPYRRRALTTTQQGALTGALPHVRLGDQIDDLLVVADDGEGACLLLLEAERTGIRLDRGDSGDPGGWLATVVLEDVATNDSDVVLSGQDASEVLCRLRSAMRLLIAYEISGLAARLLELTLEHAQLRHQFGRPVGAFQAVKHLVADMQVAAESLDSVLA